MSSGIKPKHIHSMTWLIIFFRRYLITLQYYICFMLDNKKMIQFFYIKNPLFGIEYFTWEHYLKVTKKKSK